MSIQLLVTALYNTILAIILYWIDKKFISNKVSYKLKQIIYGILFGVMAIFATTSLGGVNIGNGTIMNVRDAAPLCAGLIFGAPAGIIAGIIGGTYRYFATFYGLAGEYTQLACTISTIIAGIIAAVLRKYMFDNKKPTWIYGVGIGMICEVIHMLMIFFTNMNDVKTAFEFVKACTLPMIIGNGISVGLAILVVSIISKERVNNKNSKKQISQTFQLWLFICIVIAYIATSSFSSTVQRGMSEAETQATIKTNLEDVYKDINDALNNKYLNKKDLNIYIGGVAKNRHVGRNGFVAICDKDFNIITENKAYDGKSIKDIGIDIDTNLIKQEEIFETTVLGNTYLCAYKYVEGYYIIGTMPLEEAMFMQEVTVYVSTFMQVLIFAALFILIYFLIKKVIIDNIRKINNTLSEITGGNLDLRVDVRTNEEFASLSDDINQTVSALKGYINEAASRIDKELEFAKQIQKSSLPTAFPKRDEFDIYAKMITAKEVGGDFYDFYMINDTTVAFLVADVSGKGIPAAMFMMRAKAIIKDLTESGLPIDKIFTKANEKLCENNEAGMFVTAWMGILDLKSGLMQFANAGHNPPLIKRSNGKFEYLKERSGLFLAGMDNIKYKKNEINLFPGDQILLYTDGITEATDKINNLYGEGRLEKFVNSIKNANSEELCKSIKRDVDKFVENAEQFDDITMLAIALNCIKNDNRILTVPNKNSRIIIKKFADKLALKLETIPKLSNKIKIITDEIYSNIVNYSKASLAEISYYLEGDNLYLLFIDNGVPYNPVETKEPDTKLSIEERELGGLGIFMVKNMTEKMEYKYEENKNILRLVIKFK